MRPLPRSGRNTRGNGRTGSENLGVNAIRRDAQLFKPGSQIAHEGGGAADVEIAIARQVELTKDSRIQMPRRVEINVDPILRIRRAVANMAMMVGKCFEQSACFLGKRMFAAVTGSV